ncbi:CASP-like protein 4A3 [Linum grandiflorum]
MGSRATNKSTTTTTNMKRSSSSNSDSQQPQPQQQYQHMDSPHSPLRFHSPLRSFSPLNSPENPPVDDSKAVVAVSKVTHHTTAPPPPSSKSAPPPPPGTAVNRVVWEEVPQSARKVEPDPEGVGSARRRSGKVEKLRLAELCFRIGELSLCLISFSIMAANKTKGWSGDSFNRYKEYIYCLAVNVIGFAYSTFQAFDMGYYMGTGKHIIRSHRRWHVNFFFDQAGSSSLLILAYLLVSASSSAATRVDDWQSNWGKDEFTKMATASVAMSFLAFVAFAVSSIISGYNCCNRESI